MAKTATQGMSAEQLLEEHQELMRKVTDIRKFWKEVCELGIGPRCSELAERMAEIRKLLDHHFEVEEADGYLAPALELAPRFAPEAKELAAQHQAFLDRLDGMMDRLRDAESEVWNSVCDELEAFVGELQEHEHRENNIVQAAFNEEPGAGD